MPEMTAGQRASGGWANNPRVPLPPEWQKLADRVLPRPDQSRYGPKGSTDSPRFRADGVTPWPRESKGDSK